MKPKRDTLIMNCVCLLLVLICCILNVLDYLFSYPFAVSNLICCLYFIGINIWIEQIKRRIVNERLKRWLIATAWQLIIWMIAYTLRLDYFPAGHIMTRLLWYAYYIPIVLAIQFAFFSVLHIDKSNDETIDPRWLLMGIPDILLFAAVLTNDSHQLFLRFPGGLGNWSIASSESGILYHLCMGWLTAIVLGGMAICFFKCRIRNRKKYIWVPFIPLIFALVYSFQHFRPNMPLLSHLFSIPEIGTWSVIAFIECLLQFGFLPSNDRYGLLLQRSSLSPSIMDLKGNMILPSPGSSGITLTEVRKALRGNLALDENRVLRSTRIEGGYCFWIKDMSVVHSFNRQLMETAGFIEEENRLLQSETSLKEARIQLQEQSRLLDKTARACRHQTVELRQLLSDFPEEDPGRRENLLRAAVLATYVKRHSNLLLLAENSETISLRELALTVRESLDAFSSQKITCACFMEEEGFLSSEQALFCHRLLETVIEAALPDVKAVMVTLTKDGSRWFFKTEVSGPSASPDLTELEKELPAGCRFIRMQEEDTGFVGLILPEGGAI